MNFDNKNKDTIKVLFNQIARKYDLMNNFMSFFLHKNIKLSAVKNSIDKLGYDPKRILDICCGSGDISIMFKNLFPDAEVIGLDFSEEMLKIAKERADNIEFLQCDVTKENYFLEGKFDICFISFGLRNLPDIDKFLNTIKKYINEGGVFAILDVGKPNVMLRPYCHFHYNVIIPLLAKIFNKRTAPYKYFIDSIKRYPTQDEILKILTKNGFVEVENRNFYFGILANQLAKYSQSGQ